MTSSKKASTQIGRYSFFIIVTLLAAQICLHSDSALGSSQPYITAHQINFGTGNKYLSETDIQLSGPVMDFSFKRTYNSQSGKSSILGHGWAATNTETLTIDGTSMVLSQAGGRLVIFVDDGAGGWVNETGANRTVSSIATGYQLSELSGTVKHFNTVGNLTSITDINGNSRTYNYTDSQLSSIVDNFGLSVHFTYTGGLLTTVFAPVGTFGYAYDANDNLISVTKPDGSSTQYTYDDPNDIHNLTGVFDGEGIRILTAEYDTEDRIFRSAKANGDNEVIITYPSFSERQITDSMGVVTTYQLELNLGIVAVTSMEGPGCSTCGSIAASAYTYDDRLQILTATDDNGVTTSYGYDEYGNTNTITKATGTALETTTNKTYVPGTSRVQSIRKTSVSNPGQETTVTLNYDDSGNILTRIEAGFSSSTSISKTIAYSYDSYGRVITIDGPRTDVADITTLAYYENDVSLGANRGFLYTVTNALGQSVTYSNYNNFGYPEQLIDPNGTTTTMNYNRSGQLTSEKTTGQSTDYSYDQAGKLLTITMSGGRTINYSYSLSGKVERISDSVGNYINYSYDSEGRRTGQNIYDPTGLLVSSMAYQYDSSGRLHKTIQSDGGFEQFDYDAVDNLISKTNQLGKATTYSYDELNRLTSLTDPTSASTGLTYNGHDNQTTVTDSNGNITSFIYDDFNRKTSRVSPDSGVSSYTYDLADNLLISTDANGIEVRYVYDALNRLVTISYQESSRNVTYNYDQGRSGIGRLSQMVDSNGSTSYSYNQNGNVIEQVRITNGHIFTTGYGFNQNSDLTSITYPSGRLITYNRSITGRVISVTSTYKGEITTISDSIRYLPFGPVTSMTLGNGLVIDSEYDQQYRLTSATTGDVYNRTYTYLPTGQVESISDMLDSTRSQIFSYDDLGRLTGATGGYGSLDYSYDLVGNRLSKTVDGLVSQYSYQANNSRIDQIVADETTSYTYDAVGNTLTMGALAFTWDEDHRLERVDIHAETVGSYDYDGRGLRTVKTTAEGTILSLYDTNGNLLAETDETGSTIREFIYLDGQRLTLFDYTTAPEFNVNVSTTNGIEVPGIRVYTFDENNRYTGIYGTTDDKGIALFTRGDFGEGSYHFRVDYLGAQFWSEEVVVLTSSPIDVVIEDEQVGVNVIMDDTPQAGVRVYAFTETGTYLGLYSITDENGQASFNLPENQNYMFRADLLGSQYWSDSTTIIAGGGGIAINTRGGTMSITVQQGEGLPLSTIKTYLFSESGSYLGQSATSDTQGNINYRVSDGSYRIRADYLGSQFWSEVVVVTDSATETALTIVHQEVQVTVSADLAGSASLLADISCYLFSPSGRYLGINAKTDSSGQLSLNLPDQAYRLRVDYMGQQFWSEDFTWQNSSVNIPHGTGVVEVIKMGSPLQNIKVYVFSNSGSYLGINGVTDNTGNLRFVLPTGVYRFRADYQGNQYWGEDLALIAHQDNPIQIATGGGSFVLTLSEQEAMPIEGVQTYVFSEAGAYLGEYATTDSNGQVGFNLADGSYKIRIDYLGNQYWTSLLAIPTISESNFTIQHRQVQINAVTGFSGSTASLSGVKVYLFTPEGSYLGHNGTTDTNGQVTFSLPEEEFMVRVDYLNEHYFSEAFSTDELSLLIEEGRASVHLQSGDASLTGVPVYVFSESDSYLGVTGKTSEDGSISFQLPEGIYKFRADYQSAMFWASGQVTADSTQDITLQTGGGILAVTVRTDESQVISGVNCYLYNNSGTHLGQTAVTDDQGLVSFDVSDGSYRVRVDYLGAQYWSDMVRAPEILSTSVLIEHRDVKVEVVKMWADSPSPLPGVKCYLFTEAGSYTGISVTTDTDGAAHFTLPSQNYQVRADYLGNQFWSEPFVWSDVFLAIGHGELHLTVTKGSIPEASASVYLFSESGSYLGLSCKTNNTGMASFVVPEVSYRLRVDANGEQFWTTVINVLPGQENSYELDLSSHDLAHDPTNNPRPRRWDGEQPLYQPLLALNAGSLTGMLAQITTQTLLTEQARTFWYITDHLATAQLITDNQGTVIWQGNYKPFGEVEVVIDQLSSRFRFPGQYYDAETGLHYNWHRFYDPGTGRYISADPIGLTGGINLYAYANQNPVNYIDPWGLIWVTIGHDYQGSKNWLNLIGRHLAFLDEGKPLGTNPKTYEGLTRDLIQEWQHDPDNPCKDSALPMGVTRKIRQKYVSKPDPRPEGYWSASNHWWSPRVPNRTYRNY